jgi:hypothetical protein
VELFKVLEIIESDGSIAAVRIAAGVSDNEIRRFKHTANHDRAIGSDARHARMKMDPPPKPMTLPEADAMICSLVREWIRRRVEAQAAIGVQATQPADGP